MGGAGFCTTFLWGKHLRKLAIVHLEMNNLLLAICIFAPHWHKKAILVICDNIAVNQVLASGKTKDPFLATCALNMWMVAALADTELKYKHIRGCNSTAADLLSRWRFIVEQYAKLHTPMHDPIWVDKNSLIGSRLSYLNTVCYFPHTYACGYRF